MAIDAKTGVLLVNLGTPDEPTPAAVKKYLREFLWDPRVVQIPRLPWWFILNFLVLPLRSGKVAAKYGKVWLKDGSPLRVYHLRQAQMLKGYLGERFKAALPVVGAMRYGSPSIAEGLEALKSRGCERVLLFPLYPQFSHSTTTSVKDVVPALLKRVGYAPSVKLLKEFHAHPAYAKAIARNINEYWMKHGRPDKLVMSFHGLPRAMVDAGDPYEQQCHASGQLIATELGWNDARTIVTFQSRFGRQEWIGPATDEMLASLGEAGTGRVDVVCPGFAADCLETLEEIAIEGRRTFLEAGGKEFHYIPSTNDTPAWMTALAAVAGDFLEKWDRKQGDA